MEAEGAGSGLDRYLVADWGSRETIGDGFGDHAANAGREGVVPAEVIQAFIGADLGRSVAQREVVILKTIVQRCKRCTGRGRREHSLPWPGD